MGGRLAARGPVEKLLDRAKELNAALDTPILDANERGGRLYLGVTDEGHVKGLQLTRGDRDEGECLLLLKRYYHRCAHDAQCALRVL